MSPVSPAPLLEVSLQGQSTVARLAGCAELHEGNAEAFGRQLSRLAEGGPARHLVVDLGAVAYLTSTALGQLVGLHRRLRAEGGRLTVANVRPAVREVFSVTRLDTLLEVLPAA
jgi:anti-sigma B factor antagonist